MFVELKETMVGRYANVFGIDSSSGFTQRVKVFEGVISKTEKFGYVVYAPEFIDNSPISDPMKKLAKGVKYIPLIQENVVDIQLESQSLMRIVLTGVTAVRTISDIEFIISEDPMKKIENYEKLGNHAVFHKFFLDIELCREGAKMPTRANHDDAGLDVYSPCEHSIAPRGDVLIPAGLKMHFPKGYAVIVKEKSGRATKNKLDCGAAVIDSGYMGEVHIHLFNNSDVEVKIPAGEKVAQFLVVPVWHGLPKQVDKIERETTRGAGGFGSSGLK